MHLYNTTGCSRSSRLPGGARERPGCERRESYFSLTPPNMKFQFPSEPISNLASTSTRGRSRFGHPQIPTPDGNSDPKKPLRGDKSIGLEECFSRKQL